ncbi:MULTISPECIES: DUF3592 domain-containing protein [Aquimarina]|uniref:DUF3592 domain-containing protein n=1 Tax=Aquimarina algiphila TaxID=2047982 RepID=A0A554VFE7_9FLAO|nr:MULTISPECIES: DUF3592 domain-containing protein [Aquimarina]TSE05971.1 DUF3592 domain-containing protein [Aquimarina algiphila]
MDSISLTKNDIQHIKRLLDANRKIEAIKYINENYKLGLKESKKIADLVEKKGDFQYNSTSSQTLFIDREKTKSNRTNSIVFLIISGIGYALLLLGLYQLTDKLLFISEAKKVDGIIIAYDSHQSRSDNKVTTMYTPIFEFEVHGKKYKRKTDTSSSAREYVVGEEISLYVSNDFPKNKKVCLDEFWEKFGLATVILIFASAFIGIGYISKNALGKNFP